MEILIWILWAVVVVVVVVLLCVSVAGPFLNIKDLPDHDEIRRSDLL